MIDQTYIRLRYGTPNPANPINYVNQLPDAVVVCAAWSSTKYLDTPRFNPSEVSLFRDRVALNIRYESMYPASTKTVDRIERLLIEYHRRDHSNV